MERFPHDTSLIDLFDRVFDKGIVIDAWLRVAAVGIDLMDLDVRVVVASIEMHLGHASVGVAQPDYPVGLWAIDVQRAIEAGQSKPVIPFRTPTGQKPAAAQPPDADEQRRAA